MYSTEGVSSFVEYQYSISVNSSFSPTLIILWGNEGVLVRLTDGGNGGRRGVQMSVNNPD